jgi:predicted metal-binding membrane protein
MRRTPRRPEAWLVMLGSTSLAAWLVLALGGNGLTLPTFCAAGTPWTVPLSVSLDLALIFDSPARITSSWALMVAAMMFPLLMAPLRHVRDRSFVRRRAWAMLLFVSGYATVWMGAGAGLQAIALVVRSAAAVPLVCLGLAAATAVGWQVSPAKQWCLNRCHRRPHLTAFGPAADRDAFEFGLAHGAACAGACWALMLLTLFVSNAHVLWMIAIALFVFAERLESPAPLAWRWRGPGKALRIATAQARMRLAPRNSIRAVSISHPPITGSVLACGANSTTRQD